MPGFSIRAVAGLAMLAALGACVTTTQPDGSTRRSFSLDSLLGKDKPDSEAADPLLLPPSVAPAPVPVPAPAASGKANGKTSSKIKPGKGPAAAAVAASTTPAAPSAINARARLQFQQALSCIAAGKSFSQAETVLRQIGWTSSQGMEPVELPESVKVFGLNVGKVAIAREGSVQTYRSFFPGVSDKQLVKAAALKKADDSSVYARATSLGKLELGNDAGEPTLSCTVKVDPAAR